MKIVINRKKYDTDTAEFLTGYSSRMPGDFYYYEEELYRKKTGEYFLYGSGNALSPYGRREGNNCFGTEEIIPYTEEEAKDWVEENAPEKYEDIFGEVEE